MNVYGELLKEIELHENYLDAAELEYKYYNDILNNRNPIDIKAICYDNTIKGSKADMDLAQAIDRAHRWASMIDLENEIIKGLENRKAEFDGIIDSLEDIAVKVQQLRAKGLTQEEVGEIVGKCDRQIRNIEKKLKENK